MTTITTMDMTTAMGMITTTTMDMRTPRMMGPWPRSRMDWSKLDFWS